MSNRLPIPGSDDGDWGDILNSFLEVSLASDGTLNSNTVGTNQLQSNSVTNAQLDTPTQTTLASVASKYTLPSGGMPYTDLAGNIPLSLLSITGTASNSTYLRGDGSWTTPSSGSSTPPLEVISTITTSATLTAGYLTPVNANSAAVTATLPTGTNPGTQIGVSKTDSSANAVTINGDVRGTANSTASLAYQYQTLSYIADSNGSWWPISDLKPSSYFSSTYAPLASPTFTGTATTPALTVTGGTIATGNILTSDSSGNATWQAAAGGNGSGSANNATTSAPGLVQLAGDLGGSGTSATTPKVNFANDTLHVDRSGDTMTGKLIVPSLQVTGTGTSYNPSNGYVLTSDSSGNANWQAVPTVSGGSSVTQAYSFGSMGATATAQDPSTYGMQYGTLTANTSITLPTAVAGESFTLVLIQDSIGSHIPTLSGATVTYPAGNPIWVEAANAINVLELRCWDGNTWEVFPATSDVAPLTGTYLKLNGVTGANTQALRLVGATSSGAPTSSTFDIGDVSLDLTGTWWLCTTAGTPGTWVQMNAAPNRYNYSVVVATGNYAVSSSDDVVEAQPSANMTVTLPTTNGALGRQYIIKKADTSSYTVTVATTSSQTIDGQSTQVLNTAYSHLTVVSDGINWLVV
jgi:hypothetical protein